MAGNAMALWEKVARFYHETLVKSSEGPTCLARYGLNDSGLVQTHRIGYATGALTKVLPKQGGARDTLRGMGVLDESGRERFLDCLTFPILDVGGVVAGLTGVRMASGDAVHLANRVTSEQVTNQLADGRPWATTLQRPPANLVAPPEPHTPVSPAANLDAFPQPRTRKVGVARSGRGRGGHVVTPVEDKAWKIDPAWNWNRYLTGEGRSATTIGLSIDRRESRVVIRQGRRMR